MHGTPLLPPRGDHEVYMPDVDNQGHNLHHHHPKGNRNRDPPRTTGFILERDITPDDEGMPEKRDKKRSIGEAG